MEFDFQVHGLTLKGRALVVLYKSTEPLTARDLSDATADRLGYAADEYWIITQAEWERALDEMESEGEIVKVDAGYLCLSSS